MNFDIEQFLDLTGYEQSRLDRRKNNKEGKSTQEFFTPYSIVKRMCDKVDESDWKNIKIRRKIFWLSHLSSQMKYRYEE